jgi:hypothetical protein
MPRKQRFKPSRKPKPIDPAATPTTTNENAQQGASRPPAVIATETSPSPEDVSNET